MQYNYKIYFFIKIRSQESKREKYIIYNNDGTKNGTCTSWEEVRVNYIEFGMHDLIGGKEFLVYNDRKLFDICYAKSIKEAGDIIPEFIDYWQAIGGASLTRLENVTTFIQIYKTKLLDCVKKYPEEYYFKPEQVDEVADRMSKALLNGTYNYKGKALAATCKVLNIKNTRKEMEKFFNGD